MKKIFVPGSKSITNRVLYLSALCAEPTVLYGVLESDDTRYMRNALRNFGVRFEEVKVNGQPQGIAPTNFLRVVPPDNFSKNFSENFIGNAGTAARFLSAFSLIAEGDFSLTGVERMSARPFGDLFAALRDLGVDVEDEGKGSLPVVFSVGGGQPQGIVPTVEISGRISSQFLSGLLLTAPRMENGLRVMVKDSLPSRPYIEMTLDILKIWGVDFEVDADFREFFVKPGLKSPGEFMIPGDSSGASYPAAFTLLSGKDISIENFGENPMQGDAGFLEIVKKFGGDFVRDGDGVEIISNKMTPSIPLNQKIQGEEETVIFGSWENPAVLDFEAMPDVSMTGMILAAVGRGTTKFVGLESLRVKECDRIEAMRLGLVALGVDVKVEGDDMWITGNGGDFLKGQQRGIAPTENLVIDSFDDHRIAFCFGLLQKVFGLDFAIKDDHCVSKTWPNFWIDLADWQAKLRPVSGVIVRRNSEKYLIVKKPRKDHAWQFPQGGVDKGETLKRGALRELAEECGENLVVKIKGERPVGSYKYLFPEDFQRHIIKKDGILKYEGAEVNFFVADFVEGEVEVDGVELVDYKWVRKDELGEFFEGDYLEEVEQFL